MPYLLLFPNITQLYEAESVLKEKQIPNQLISSPELPEGVGDNCGDLAIAVEDPEIGKMFAGAKVIEVPPEAIL